MPQHATPDFELKAFQSLGRYKHPPLPTVDAVHRLIYLARKSFRTLEQKPFIEEDRLNAATLGPLDEFAIPPVCSPLLNELELTLADWIGCSQPTEWLKVIVVPPCDENQLVEHWARENNYQLLQPPTREALLGEQSSPDFQLNGDGVLVIPQLECWFIRHRNGLTQIRQLLRQLATLQRRCVIGCNSWAWQFLRKAVNAEMILPNALSFSAFDARRMHDWFGQLSTEHEGPALTFRSSENGEKVMGLNEAAEPKHEYFAQLAARSLGLPWVAWCLWHRGLRARKLDDEVSDQEKIALLREENTLWVTKLREFELPEKNMDAMLLVLHAILIHGTIDLQHMPAVLPEAGEPNIIYGLITMGVIRENQGQLSCIPAAYPAVRKALATAGYSMDKL